MPSIENFHGEVVRLVLWFCVMLVLALVHAVTLLVSARKVDPLPLLPLIGMMFAVQTGIRLAVVWFGLGFQFIHPDPWFWEWWREMIDPAVLRPMAWVFTALVGHGAIHWGVALRGTFKRKRGRISTLIVSGCAVANMLISLHVAAALFDFLYLSQKREAENLVHADGLDVWNHETPDAEHPWFRMIFITEEQYQ